MAGRHRSLRSTKNLWDPGSGHPCRSCMVWPSPMVRRAGGVPSSPRRWRPASCVLRASESSAPSPGVRSHGRFRNRGTDSLSESGMKWMCGGTQRQRDRALRPPARRGRRRVSATPARRHPHCPGRKPPFFGCCAPCAPVQTRHRKPDLLWKTLRVLNKPQHPRQLSSRVASVRSWVSPVPVSCHHATAGTIILCTYSRKVGEESGGLRG